MNNSKSDIALVSNKKLLETGTSNLLFVKCLLVSGDFSMNLSFYLCCKES